MALELQLYMFAVMVISGIIMSGLYDMYRSARFVFGWSRLLGEVTDLLFVVLGSILLLIGFIAGTWGIFRAYTVFGLLVGGWLYFSLASVFVQPAWRVLFRACQYAWLKVKSTTASVGRSVKVISSSITRLWPFRSKSSK